ncbi:endonuclease domain-containing protein [Sphingomonas faeni]|uniref:endonuclease domain-containing protein n=1 Tax=Sphingomonas faeni TaxID=185950 RepID=UPI00335D063B
MYPVRRQISRHAARLRRERTDVEQIIWLAVRNRRLGGFKFREQHTIGDHYVADFTCLEAMLIVELDGSQHDPKIDAPRTAFLEAKGYQVLRFWNNDIIENRDGVLETIIAAFLARTAK